MRRLLFLQFCESSKSLPNTAGTWGEETRESEGQRLGKSKMASKMQGVLRSGGFRRFCEFLTIFRSVAFIEYLGFAIFRMFQF